MSRTSFVSRGTVEAVASSTTITQTLPSLRPEILPSLRPEMFARGAEVTSSRRLSVAHSTTSSSQLRALPVFPRCFHGDHEGTKRGAVFAPCSSVCAHASTIQCGGRGHKEHEGQDRIQELGQGGGGGATIWSRTQTLNKVLDERGFHIDDDVSFF